MYMKEINKTSGLKEMHHLIFLKNAHYRILGLATSNKQSDPLIAQPLSGSANLFMAIGLCLVMIQGISPTLTLNVTCQTKQQ